MHGVGQSEIVVKTLVFSLAFAVILPLPYSTQLAFDNYSTSDLHKHVCMPQHLLPCSCLVNPHPIKMLFYGRITSLFVPNKRRAPFDNEYILGLLWQQRQHLAVAGVMLLLCTTSNLAAPVLSGILMEMLVHQQPMEKYGQVRRMWPNHAVSLPSCRLHVLT